MDDLSLATQSFQLIRKDLGLEESISFDGKEHPLDWLEECLTRQVSYLLDHDMERLLNALYRIDAHEAEVKALLHASPPELMAANLAHAIIAREKQKVITRQQYRPS